MSTAHPSRCGKHKQARVRVIGLTTRTKKKKRKALHHAMMAAADASKASIPHHKVLEMGRSAIVFEPTRFINLPRPAGAIRKEDSVEKDGKKEEAPKIAKHMPTEKEQDKAGRQGTFEFSRMPDPVSELEQWIEQTFN